MSGGEKQRVAIGRALIKNPSFCFADEPTSALDWAHGKQVVDLLKVAAKVHNATVVIVAHDKRLEEFADTKHYLEDGRLRPAEEDPSRHHPVTGWGGNNGKYAAEAPAIKG